MYEYGMVELMMKFHFLGGFLLASVIFLLLLAGYCGAKRLGRRLTQEVERLIREVERDEQAS